MSREERLRAFSPRSSRISRWRSRRFPRRCRIAHRIALAARHLHRCGIMHGDLYAYNILHDGSGHVLLGDFGAASVHDIDDHALAQAFERVEVRAIGGLREELAQRLAGEADDRAAGIHALIEDCIGEHVEMRPSFDEIVGRLSA
ncbi:protein kinase [Paraburkholderia sp. CNPSo 3076]|uniref:protein kinase n=1 Tax=Paraburkholderia sp. CNPSo 3076 TaxID=2940936 RepID=UPI002B1E0E40|nr:protein kinase [Paraburkholderia sp. CNPSo 3076]